MVGGGPGRHSSGHFCSPRTRPFLWEPQSGRNPVLGLGRMTRVGRAPERPLPGAPSDWLCVTVCRVTDSRLQGECALRPRLGCPRLEAAESLDPSLRPFPSRAPSSHLLFSPHRPGSCFQLPAGTLSPESRAQRLDPNGGSLPGLLISGLHTPSSSLQTALVPVPVTQRPPLTPVTPPRPLDTVPSTSAPHPRGHLIIGHLAPDPTQPQAGPAPNVPAPLSSLTAPFLASSVSSLDLLTPPSPGPVIAPLVSHLLAWPGLRTRRVSASWPGPLLPAPPPPAPRLCPGYRFPSPSLSTLTSSSAGSTLRIRSTPPWTEGKNSRGRPGWEPNALPAPSLPPGTRGGRVPAGPRGPGAEGWD